MKEYKLMKKQEKLCEWLAESLRDKVESELVSTEQYVRECYAREVDEMRRTLSNFKCGKWKIAETNATKEELSDKQIRVIANLITGDESELKKYGFCALCANFDFLAGSCCHSNGTCTNGVIEFLKNGIKGKEKKQ